MYEQIAANKRKTVLLFLGAFLFLVAVGYLIGRLTGYGALGLAIALIVAVVMSISSYMFGDRLVLCINACARGFC